MKMKIITPWPRTAIDQDALGRILPITKQHGGQENEIVRHF